MPDIRIEKENGRFVAKKMRSEYQFRIDNYYYKLLKSSKDPNAQKYLLDKLQRANALLFGIEQRDATIVRCAQEIADKQTHFFATGEGLIPMKMTEIAQKLKLHNSTISRAVRLKYILCDYGVYPMSFFFSNSEIKDTGVGSDTVKAEIRNIIEGEDPLEPFSDQSIMEQLVYKGYQISRRTIAKYRQELGISNAFERKKG